jgi:uncharacterized iron-regulated membrane protein
MLEQLDELAGLVLRDPRGVPIEKTTAARPHTKGRASDRCKIAAGVMMGWFFIALVVAGLLVGYLWLRWRSSK